MAVTMTTMDITNYSMTANMTSLLVDDVDCALFGRFIINTLVAGLLCLLGLLGNWLCFLVLRKDQDTPIASFLLQTLACCDNAFLSLWLLHFSLRDLFAYLHVYDSFHVAWMYVVLYTYPLLFVAQSATTWLTVLIAVYRYLAVCKPYTVHFRMDLLLAKKCVVCVIIWAFVYNLPRYFETTIEFSRQQQQQQEQQQHLTDGGDSSTNNSTTAANDVAASAVLSTKSRDYKLVNYDFTRTDLGNSSLYSTIYFDILYYVFSLFLPLLLLAILNTRLTMAYRALQLRRRQRWRQRDCCGNSGDEAQMSEQNITRVLILVVLVFMMCNAPARAVQMVWRYKHQRCPSPPFILMEVSNVLEVLMSSMNFVIYCVFRKQFRYILRHQLCDSGTSDDVRVQRSCVVVGSGGPSTPLLNTGASTPTRGDSPQRDKMTPQQQDKQQRSGRSPVCHIPLLLLAVGGDRKVNKSELLLKVVAASHTNRCQSF